MYMTKINVDITPSNYRPVIRISQHDSGNEVQVTLTDGDALYIIPDGASVMLTGKTPDARAIEKNVDGSGSAATFVIDEDISGVSGQCVCKLLIHNGEAARLATQAFLIVVEPDPTTKAG